MVWGRKGLLSLVFGSVLATVGCSYHVASSGRERDFAFGGPGCEANSSARNYDLAYRPRRTQESLAKAKSPSNGGDFPIYVLPQEAVSNAVPVPNPIPQSAP